jgi:hypothetical protein
MATMTGPGGGREGSPNTDNSNKAVSIAFILRLKLVWRRA